MALKRKRSSPSFSPIASEATCSDGSSPYSLPSFYTQSKPIEPFYTKSSWSFPTYESDDSHDQQRNHVSSRHLNSRTRKRHRDDRPDEKSVFGALQPACIAWLGAADMGLFADICRGAATTLSRLYDAQRNQSRTEPISLQHTTNVRAEEPAQRSTLHSFWNIGGSMPMAVDSNPSSVINLERKCEDCEGSLQPVSAMELDDGFLEHESACAMCRRNVCDGCAVLGNERICLACASR